MKRRITTSEYNASINCQVSISICGRSKSYGLQKRIEGAGLLTSTQYLRARLHLPILKYLLLFIFF